MEWISWMIFPTLVGASTSIGTVPGWLSNTHTCQGICDQRQHTQRATQPACVSLQHVDTRVEACTSSVSLCVGALQVLWVGAMGECTHTILLLQLAS